MAVRSRPPESFVPGENLTSRASKAAEAVVELRDLSVLSKGECEILAMLAEGHTVKSIATHTGLSVAAVNERLRGARRKTGMASSRELARELRLQKNRDKEIVLPSEEGLPSSLPLPTNQRAGRRFLMALVAIAVISVAAIMVQQNPISLTREPAGTTFVDPMLKGLVDKLPNLPELHDRVREEDRDEAWASKSEAALRARYAQIPNLFAHGNVVRVICGRSLCEVAGVFSKSLTDKQLSKVVEDLQANSLQDDLEPQGLKGIGTGFGPAFVSYWGRADSAR